MEDPILFWNDLCNDANRFDHTAPMKGAAQGGPTRSSRATAIVHLAMHDAHFGVQGAASPFQLYTASAMPPIPPYAGPNTPKHISAAVSAAAHLTLTTLYPEQASRFAGAAHKIAGLNETDSGAHAYGYAIAQAILEMRREDGSSPMPPPEHVYNYAKPHHREDPINPALEPLGAAWGRVRPFAVTTFHLQDPYPTFKGAAYNADHDEVLAKGGAGSQASTTRTKEETVIGLYWAYDGAKDLGTPPRLYNQVVRVIAKNMNNSVADNARLFALVNVAMGDAGVHAWYWKYKYDLWRPTLARMLVVELQWMHGAIHSGARLAHQKPTIPPRVREPLRRRSLHIRQGMRHLVRRPLKLYVASIATSLARPTILPTIKRIILRLSLFRQNLTEYRKIMMALCVFATSASSTPLRKRCTKIRSAGYSSVFIGGLMAPVQRQ
jgi:hypothetical protein